MADTESLGEAGVRFVEELATGSPEQCRVRIPTITDPRGLDFASYKRLGQTETMADLGLPNAPGRLSIAVGVAGFDVEDEDAPGLGGHVK